MSSIEEEALALAKSDECQQRFDEVFAQGDGLEYLDHQEFVINKLTNEFITNNTDLTIEPESGEKLFIAIFQRQISQQFQREREIPSR
jgi:hypothetical protein